MAAVIQTDTDETVDFTTGKRIARQVARDVTADAVTYGLPAKARAALTGNAAYLASTPTNAQNTAQIKALTRQMNALVRLIVAADLLTDNVGT